MLMFLKLLFFLCFANIQLHANQNKYLRIFYKTLLKYNITFDMLGDRKAGAICVPKSDKNYEKYAIGFSFDMYDINYAKKISLSGCEKMKKKLILYECKCEIIYE